MLTAALQLGERREHLGAPGNPHFLIELVAVTPDGMNRKPHFRGNLLKRFPSHDAFEHLQLLTREGGGEFGFVQVQTGYVAPGREPTLSIQVFHMGLHGADFYRQFTADLRHRHARQQQGLHLRLSG